ncbi:MAG: type II toxin-antitoxin system prevent-host-death family antitoxin [Candidatus Gottesmanbacteria bacterium]|nr:type II toxin-antitoxin system prevent-host-death family antitoxin [Candidatus Gottesmanbacteria bacterium]
MLNPKSIKSISDLREDPLGVIKVAEELGEPVCVVHRSKPVGMLMNIAQYYRYRQILEDYKKGISS